MERKFVPVVVVFLVVVSSLACSLSANPTATATAEPTIDVQATKDHEVALKATEESNQKATADARAKAEEEAKAATATAVVEARIAADTATAEAKQTAEAALAATRQAATVTTIAQATGQAQPMFEVVNKLVDLGLLKSNDGYYQIVRDFDQSMAMINYYSWWPTGLVVEDFAVRAHAYWESASDIANWFASGCGFVYAENGQNNNYASFFGLDGQVHNFRYKGGIYTGLKGGYYGKIDHMKGDAELMLVVANNQSTFFVNDKKVVTYEDQYLGRGSFNLTVVSGTNKGFGTHCKMNNIEMWIQK